MFSMMTQVSRLHIDTDLNQMTSLTLIYQVKKNYYISIFGMYMYTCELFCDFNRMFDLVAMLHIIRLCQTVSHISRAFKAMLLWNIKENYVVAIQNHC